MTALTGEEVVSVRSFGASSQPLVDVGRDDCRDRGRAVGLEPVHPHPDHAGHRLEAAVHLAEERGLPEPARREREHAGRVLVVAVAAPCGWRP